ncbi:MAG TPA: hypothetical protein VFS77_11940, partial [Pyrinomonadaceae bacterium]|nr:hypothetical protein [Pyrinomonadaceae bacterium]
VGSLLYTFIPYHFFRGEGHLFYSAYYMVPLMVLVILWTYFGTLQLVRQNPETRRPALNFRNFKAIFSLIVAVVIASSGAYYSFFGCFLLLVVGLLALIQKRGVYPLVTAVILVAVISITTVVNLSPHIVYLREHGNPQSMARSAQEAERFGLKIAQMLLPISGHRVSSLARLKHDYSHAPLVNENNNASLGFVGAIGFLLLLGVLLVRPRERDSEEDLLPALSKLNLAALLLATIGGFGSLFALLISPHIRSYNRFSIYIAFFCVFAVVVVLDGFARRRVRTKNGRIIFAVVLGVLLVLGILDQTSKLFVPDYRGLEAEWIDQDRFVARVEETVPSGSMVFQLPYIPFPEHPPLHGMLDYDHLKAYLHSKSLRWSYGAIRGREGDEWQKSVAALPVPEFLESLAYAGFNGVYIDRYGYEDKGAAIESEFATALGTTPVTSNNGRFAFFPMTAYVSQLRQKYTEQEWAAKKDAVLPAITFYWRAGFSELEHNGDENWRWCSTRGELDLYNRSDRERKIVLEMSFSTGYDAVSDLTISGSLLSDQLKINSQGRAYTMTLTVPPGHNVLEFVSNAPPVKTVNDPRTLIFRVNNFRIKETN